MNTTFVKASGLVVEGFNCRHEVLRATDLVNLRCFKLTWS
jgi:hypothetical protein